eukprot:CAMPEP_0202920590 /NCGR_PEP_ID=MMETSP1392-20130828/76938_1 /ASSEMBLY_ACC=CAM_ASM_000868 /TAXON_ID=225041 /ORGANISM="Chlamydomonas chlamydogama, Strain SAG 11-48b" /LENGTH=95 /DNA_ID=CAMNT_0049614093 /DNA_START=1662 /DNA_END=1950 /DNA_ORIENTATION=+
MQGGAQGFGAHHAASISSPELCGGAGPLVVVISVHGHALAAIAVEQQCQARLHLNDGAGELESNTARCLQCGAQAEAPQPAERRMAAATAGELAF